MSERVNPMADDIINENFVIDRRRKADYGPLAGKL